MKTNLTTIACLIFLALATPAYSADKPRVFDLEFNGGTVEEFIDAIKDLDINILTTPEGRVLRMPRFKLHNITADDLFTFLNLAGGNSGYTWQLTNSQKNPGDPGKNNIWVLKAPENNPNAANKNDSQQNSGPQAMPIAIGHLIKDKPGENGYTIEQITTAIEKTVEADYKARGADDKNRIAFQYHKDTKLLIVSGEFRAVQLAMFTINTLKKSLGYVSK